MLHASLALTHVALAAREIGHALPRVVEDGGGFLFARRQRLRALLELLDQRRDVALLLRKTFLGAGNDVLRESETSGNGDPVRAPGNSLDQSIRGREGLGVELQRRVHDARDFCCKLLQSPQVGRGNCHRAATRQIFEYCPAQSRAFHRIGTRPEVAERTISAKFFTCALNVDRLASIDCSSPMSAKKSS